MSEHAFSLSQQRQTLDLLSQVLKLNTRKLATLSKSLAAFEFCQTSYKLHIFHGPLSKSLHTIGITNEKCGEKKSSEHFL